MNRKENFNSWKVEELKRWLGERNISCSGYNKAGLVTIAEAASTLNLPQNPDLQSEESANSSSLDKLLSLGCSVDPFKMKYGQDFQHFPVFGLIDIFNYLSQTTAAYDKKALKAYKSLEDYRLCADKHVLMLENTQSDGLWFVKASVRPTQRDKTYLNKDCYCLWITFSEAGDIETAYCECQGGADGACRHVSASLFTLEEFLSEQQSVTSGPCQWIRRAKPNDSAVAVTSLDLRQARFRTVDAGGPHKKRRTMEEYDPRAPEDRVPNDPLIIKDWWKGLKQNDKECGAVDMLQESSSSSDDSGTPDPDIICLSLMSRAKSVANACGQSVDSNTLMNNLLANIRLTEAEINKIEKATRGQSSNPNWKELRKGMITSSNFKRVCTRMDTLSRDATQNADNLTRSLMDGGSISPDNPPAAIAWGRKNEPKARKLYTRVQRRTHSNVKVMEAGLIVDKGVACIGASPDGILTCKCHGKRLLEIKCPYQCRNMTPKQAASERGCVIDSGNIWSLKESSDYYYQIQGALGCGKYDICDLVIYTNKGILIVPVPFNKEFFVAMRRKIVDFYRRHMIESLINHLRD